MSYQSSIHKMQQQNRSKYLQRNWLFIAIGLLLCNFNFSSPVQAEPVQAAPAYAAPTVTEVSKELVCPCPDCGKQALDQCPTCSIGQKNRDIVAGLIKQGKTKSQILSYFATTYGAQMLGDPPASGFGLWARLMPLLVGVLGLVPITLLLRARAKKQANVTPESTMIATPAAAASTLDSSDEARVNAALHKFEY